MREVCVWARRERLISLIDSGLFNEAEDKFRKGQGKRGEPAVL